METVYSSPYTHIYIMSQINALASQVLQDPAVGELSVAGGSTLCFNVAGRSYTVEQAGKGFTLYDGSGKKEMKNAAQVLTATGITVPTKSKKAVPPVDQTPAAEDGTAD